MPDDPTLGEVVRSLNTFREDTREDLANLGRRIDAKVRQDVYAADQTALRNFISAEIQKVTTALTTGLQSHAEKINAIEDAQEKAHAKRWQVYALVGGAILTALLPLALNLLRAALTTSGTG